MKKPDFRALLGAPTARERIAARGGTYTLALSALVLAILIAVNVLFSVLPRSLTLALDNARFPEVSIALYRADGSRCLAAADGVTVGYVPRSEVVDLIEAVNAIVLGSPEESGSG